MSHNKAEQDKEDFKTFLDLYLILQKEIDEQEPSKARLKKILENMLKMVKIKGC